MALSHSLEERKTPLSLTTSVIVPCHYTHFKYIPELLRYYQDQTVIPNEVVISVSQYKKLPKGVIKLVESENWPFRLVIICNKGAVSAGQNRNLAFSKSSGDLIICQDADDIPHPQRLEIIKSLFEKYQIDHLMHLYKFDDKFVDYNLEIAAEKCECFTDFLEAQAIYPTNGVPAYLRHVNIEIQWPNSSKSEDFSFNCEVYKKYIYTVIYKGYLYCYRGHLTISLTNKPGSEKKRRMLEDYFSNLDWGD